MDATEQLIQLAHRLYQEAEQFEGTEIAEGLKTEADNIMHEFGASEMTEEPEPASEEDGHDPEEDELMRRILQSIKNIDNEYPSTALKRGFLKSIMGM